MSRNRGFGVGAVIVIVALILIIGGYMYYSRNNQPVVPADIDVTVGTTTDTNIFEDGTATNTATTTATTTATGTSSAR